MERFIIHAAQGTVRASREFIFGKYAFLEALALQALARAPVRDPRTVKSSAPVSLRTSSRATSPRCPQWYPRRLKWRSASDNGVSYTLTSFGA
ncbi:hypothetical protein NDU88_002711 [Pleurodeles waltl]|uniref:Uncharacterized protein n=1 Tax=Pleurodeles waltl TaxID=8319 RepID=A0AAV7TMF1_PLEWA|nr:hypothetical protein NDU88_002711 [Pleurodeles waltl]